MITTTDLDNSGKLKPAVKGAKRIITTTNTPGPRTEPAKDRAAVGEDARYVGGKRVRVITTTDLDKAGKPKP